MALDKYGNRIGRPPLEEGVPHKKSVSYSLYQRHVEMIRELMVSSDRSQSEALQRIIQEAWERSMKR